jgi:viroplasmin and RNaseH domain-containing protein
LKLAIRKDTEMQNYYRNIKVKRKSVIIKVAHKMAEEFFQSLKQKHLIKLIEFSPDSYRDNKNNLLNKLNHTEEIDYKPLVVP